MSSDAYFMRFVHSDCKDEKKVHVSRNSGDRKTLGITKLLGYKKKTDKESRREEQQ